MAIASDKRLLQFQPLRFLRQRLWWHRQGRGWRGLIAGPASKEVEAFAQDVILLGIIFQPGHGESAVACL